MKNNKNSADDANIPNVEWNNVHLEGAGVG